MGRVIASRHNKGGVMAHYVLLLNWTDQGIRNVKETVKRAADARQLVERSAGKIGECFWTLGPYDLVLTAEAPDDETMTAISIKLGMLGNVKTTTMRAFGDAEMEKIIQRVG
jgi:uncharacterized protein with GYD domain